MEHYSRDRVMLRIFNTIFFVVLLGINIKYYFFNGKNSLINHIGDNFYMSPFKAIYILYIITIIFLAVFIIIQGDSTSYGIKKKTIENFGISIILIFLFSILNIYFFAQKSLKISIIFAMLSIVFSIYVYLKSQYLKKYMYDDEIRVFVYPFSMLLSWNFLSTFMTANMVINNKITQNSNLFVIIGLIELLLILMITMGVLFLFKDKMIAFVNIYYLVCIAVNTKLNDYFMPLGYICFLEIILIFVFLYKISKRKN